MNFYYLLIILSIGFQAERGIFDLFSYFKLFKQLSQKCSNKSKEAKKTLYILIPVLNEQKIIACRFSTSKKKRAWLAIAGHINLSRERVRQIFRTGPRKIRQRILWQRFRRKFFLP